MSVVYGQLVRYGTIDFTYAEYLSTRAEAEDGPVYMLNLMKYRDVADYGEQGSGDAPSGREADDRYAPLDVLSDIGARVCFFADVVEATEEWDRVGVVRYPTRRSFIEMQSRRDFQERHVHKEAGMLRTIVVGTLPNGELPPTGGEGRILLEVWDGKSEPAPGEGASTFTVEGTIVGDGRKWATASYRAVGADAVLPAGDEHHQCLLLSPGMELWS